ncbi:MAG: restriction endonuclease subunit S, partial [Prevotella sp.]
MAIVKFGDIVRDVKINIDRANNPYEHYVAGDHMDSEDLTIHSYGSFETDDVGPAFTRIFKPGQILYGSRRTYLKKVAVADFEGICANTTFVLESKDEALFDNRLLPFIMLSDAFTRWSIAHSKGSTNPYVLFSDLADYEFDLPPIAEQKVLADKLWAAYRLKESYKKLLAATEEMVKSRFIEMFGECQRKEKLSSLCETFIDGDWIESKDQSEDGIRLVQTGNVGYGYFKDKEDKSRYISEETFNRLHCTEIFAGDILVSRLPDPIGRACIIPEGIGRMITAVDCSIIRLKDVILPEYFISYTMTSTYSAQINEVTTGTTRRRVSRANLGNVLVPCPSLEAQRQFVAISQQADKSKFELRKSIESIDKV